MQIEFLDVEGRTPTIPLKIGTQVNNNTTITMVKQGWNKTGFFAKTHWAVFFVLSRGFFIFWGLML